MYSTDERERPVQLEVTPMAEQKSGYGRNWKKWLAIYLVAGAVVYVVIYLLFFAGNGGGGGGGLYG